MNNNINDTAAEGAITATMISAIAHYATLLQPILSFCVGIMTLISAFFAIRYYYLKTKK
jgi:hypothetical protein